MTDPASSTALRGLSTQIRRDIIEMIYRGGGGHPGGSLSSVEILVCLYFQVMRLRPDEPAWPERDRFVLSKGHAAPALYAALARRGYFPVELLPTFGQPGTRLQKHPDMHRLPGIELSAGSLGHGLSVAVGMALADRIDRKERRVYALISDGECQEGQVWEAAMAASAFGLDRLIALTDCNRLQVDGFIDDIMPIQPLDLKWQSFGWQVQRVDGHDPDALLAAFAAAQATAGRPHMILADTVKGKGVSFMENRIEWHSHPLSVEQFRRALAELAHSEAVEA